MCVSRTIPLRIMNNRCRNYLALLQQTWCILFANGAAQSEFSPVRSVPMSFGWKKVMLAAVATLTLGTVAQASGLSLQRIADYSGERIERQDYSGTEHWSERRTPDRYQGRPVPEWRERWSHQGGYYGAPVAERPH